MGRIETILIPAIAPVGRNCRSLKIFRILYASRDGALLLADQNYLASLVSREK